MLRSEGHALIFPRPLCMTRTQQQLIFLMVLPLLFVALRETASTVTNTQWESLKAIKNEKGSIVLYRITYFLNYRSDKWTEKDVKLFPNVFLNDHHGHVNVTLCSGSPTLLSIPCQSYVTFCYIMQHIYLFHLFLECGAHICLCSY